MTEENKQLKKKRVKVQGEECYFLGIDKDGERVYLNVPRWDCGHYWASGYLQRYRGLTNTERNWSSHTHFKGNIIGQQEEYNFKKGCFEKTKYTHHLNEVLKETVLTDSESWTLSELMQSIEILKETSSFFNKGGAHMTKNPIREELISEDMYLKINKELLPKLFKEVDKLLKAEKDEPLNITLEDSQINRRNGGFY